MVADISGAGFLESYYWQVEALTATGWSSMRIWQFTVSPVPPRRPILSAPVNNALTNDPIPIFSWNSVAEGSRYEIEIDRSTALQTVEMSGSIFNIGDWAIEPVVLIDGNVIGGCGHTIWLSWAWSEMGEYFTCRHSSACFTRF